MAGARSGAASLAAAILLHVVLAGALRPLTHVTLPALTTLALALALTGAALAHAALTALLAALTTLLVVV
jgi:hypothetical protein